MDRLKAIEILKSIQRYKGIVNQQQGATCALYPKDFPALDQAISDMQAIEDGRMVELKVKPGDTVYYMNTEWLDKIYPQVVTQVSFERKGHGFLLTEDVVEPEFQPAAIEDLNKIKKTWKGYEGVFTSLEAAQNALKGE